MQRHVRNDLAYCTFDSLAAAGRIVHAISTRHGGVSPAPFDTLNISKSVGDSTENVAANLERWYSGLGLDRGATVTASQAQADQIAIITREHRGVVIPNVDALITREPNIPLLLRFADCVPILLYDPVQHAVGIVHAGWRGTVANITTKAVRAMTQSFGSRPRDLIAGIGPAIGACCYRVGADVIAQVRAVYREDGVLRDGAYFDLWEGNARQLRECGVAQIEIARLCTAEHTDDFYSHRAERGRTGRFGAVIALKV